MKYYKVINIKTGMIRWVLDEDKLKSFNEIYEGDHALYDLRLQDITESEYLTEVAKG